MRRTKRPGRLPAIWSQLFLHWQCTGVAAVVSLMSCKQTPGDQPVREDGATDVPFTPSDIAGREGTLEDPSPFRCNGACTDTLPRPGPLPRPVCPVEEPAYGNACEQTGLICGYGTSPNPFCRRDYECEESTWVVPQQLQQTRCVELPAGYCPQERPPDGTPCLISDAGTEAPCSYGDLGCYCQPPTPFYTGNEGNWTCLGPPMDPRCPASIPNIGEGCATQALECYYEASACGAHPYSHVFCYRGAWEPSGTRGICHN